MWCNSHLTRVYRLYFYILAYEVTFYIQCFDNLQLKQHIHLNHANDTTKGLGLETMLKKVSSLCNMYVPVCALPEGRLVYSNCLLRQTAEGKLPGFWLGNRISSNPTHPLVETNRVIQFEYIKKRKEKNNNLKCHLYDLSKLAQLFIHNNYGSTAKQYELSN